MTNESGGRRRLPDEAFASPGARPNPRVDEHVAFPDEIDQSPRSLPPGSLPPTSLPSSAWAPRGLTDPRQSQVPPELAHMPPEVLGILREMAARLPSKTRTRGRLRPAGLGLAAVVALALILSENSSVQPDVAGTVADQGWAAAIEPRPVPMGEIGGMQPVDQPRYEIPLGFSRIRIEVVGDDPSADIVVTSSSGDASLGEVALPYGAELDLAERPDQLAVTVNGHGHGLVQCRIHANGQLVSIATGAGAVECQAAPGR